MSKYVFMVNSICLVLLLNNSCTRSSNEDIIPFGELEYVVPEDAAKKAIIMYDSNNDGKISGSEFDQCPSLKNGLTQFKSNVENGINATDITNQITKWHNSKVHLLVISCRVICDGNPMEGCDVKFVPETFLGSSYPEGYAVTDKYGNAYMRSQYKGIQYLGIPPGYYRVEITNTKKHIQQKYNSQSIYGIEVALDNIKIIEAPITFNIVVDREDTKTMSDE